MDGTEDNLAIRHLRGNPDLEVMDDVHVEEGESGYINPLYDAFIDVNGDVADEEADAASLEQQPRQLRRAQTMQTLHQQQQQVLMCGQQKAL
ncbi:hypothetical protein CLOP_g15636 [Closterium sp. NIES-67]|nr:hypothetical protein CLOP_g15636 [Closterium sp. NIES-67]